MTVSELFAEIPCTIKGDPDTEISGVCYDSRCVKPGDMFYCISGFSTDGNNYAEAAACGGAAAIVTSREHPDLDIPQVLVDSDRRAMALSSAAFYGTPAAKMRMVGITGTNGKTTTTYMVKRIAERAGLKVGLIGTIRNLIGDEPIHTERTTPESPDLHRLLARMADSGCDLVVMEVSSHSLALDRTFGIPFEVGIFSNLTQDHLDFHGTLDAYLEAKARLFAQSSVSIANLDDPHVGLILESAAGDVRTYSARSTADYSAANINLTADGTQYTLCTAGASLDVAVPIPGMFTVYNSLAAASASAELGIPLQTAADALAGMPGVDGRFELLETRGRDFSLILDYAHTPDSLENTLSTVRGFAKGRVVAVFGCGGNRDRAKRPVMGAVAAQLADRLIVTSDNPRFEDPDTIIEDITAGIPKGTAYEAITDRRRAILEAVTTFQPGDVIVLAGKGHETYQEVCGVKHDFDEKTVVQDIFDQLGW